MIVRLRNVIAILKMMTLRLVDFPGLCMAYTMTETDPREEQQRSMTHEDYQSVRPHLVMAVGNAALGDSRVEKAAITARDAGYKVTVLALQRPNTAPFWFIDG